jgi:hypothetical protein
VGKTYIFFEPRKNDFFGTIVNTYSELIEGYYTDAAKAHSNGTGHTFFKNHNNALVFPACDYNNVKVGCPRTICGSDKWPVLSDNQKKQIEDCLKEFAERLRSGTPGKNMVIDRIYSNLSNVLLTKIETVSYGSDNILAAYERVIRRFSTSEDAEKSVYVSAATDSDYSKLCELLPDVTLYECPYYQ